MSNISTEIAEIESASTGEDVRQSLVDALEAINADVLPTATQSDAGKFMMVNSSGEWIAKTGGLVPTPTGTKEITQNGTYDVTDYASADVDVPNSYGAGDEGRVVSNGALVAQTSRTVTENNTYDTTLNNQIVVNVSGGGGGGSTLITKSITANGTYNAQDDSADGYSSVAVNVPAPNFFEGDGREYYFKVNFSGIYCLLHIDVDGTTTNSPDGSATIDGTYLERLSNGTVKVKSDCMIIVGNTGGLSSPTLYHAGDTVSVSGYENIIIAYAQNTTPDFVSEIAFVWYLNRSMQKCIIKTDGTLIAHSASAANGDYITLGTYNSSSPIILKGRSSSPSVTSYMFRDAPSKSSMDEIMNKMGVPFRDMTISVYVDGITVIFAVPSGQS